MEAPSQSFTPREPLAVPRAGSSSARPGGQIAHSPDVWPAPCWSPWSAAAAAAAAAATASSSSSAGFSAAASSSQPTHDTDSDDDAPALGKRRGRVEEDSEEEEDEAAASSRPPADSAGAAAPVARPAEGGGASSSSAFSASSSSASAAPAGGGASQERAAWLFSPRVVLHGLNVAVVGWEAVWRKERLEKRVKKLDGSATFYTEASAAYPSTATVSFSGEGKAMHAARVLRKKCARHAEGH